MARILPNRAIRIIERILITLVRRLLPLSGHLLITTTREFVQHLAEATAPSLLARLVDDMGYGPDQERAGCLLPVPFNSFSVRIDKQGCNVHHVTSLIDRSNSYLLKRIVSGASPLKGIRWVPTQDLVSGLVPPARRQCPVLPLNVQHHSGVFPR